MKILKTNETVVATFRINEQLLKKFEEIARKEFGNRNRALIFLIQVYVETHSQKSFIRRVLNHLK